MSRSTALVALFSVLSLSPTALFAASQQQSAKSEEPKFEIVLRPVASLGDKEGDGWVASTRDVVRTSTNYLLTSVFAMSEIRSFNRDGKFTGIVGGEGGGPGEYGMIRALRVTKNDTVHVFDVERMRRTVLSPTYEYVRSTRLPTPELHTSGGLVLRDGTVIINATLRSPERIGFPLHRLDEEGSVALSFGAIEPITVLPGRSSREDYRIMCLAQGDTDIWAALPEDLRVERWSAFSGVREVSLQRVYPPDSRIVGLREDGDGLLWILVQIQVNPNPQPGNNNLVQDYDSLLEVLDPRTGTVVARKTIDYCPLGLMPEDTVYLFDDSLEELPQIRITSAVLIPRRGRQ